MELPHPLPLLILYDTIKQWPKIVNSLSDGKLELDNDVIENKIRPLALERSYYLLVGPHAGTELVAMVYSFFSTCKAHEVRLFE